MSGAPGHDPEISRLIGGEALDDEAIAELYALPATPWLRVNFVASLDGAVEVGGVSRPLSSPADQRVMELLRTQCDALLLGAGTLRTERYGPIVLPGPRRRWRGDHGLAEHPTVVVVSGSLNLDPAAPAFAAAPTRPIVLTTTTTPAASGKAMAAVADVISTGNRTVDLADAVAQLHDRGLRRILCEGGPHLFGALAAADLVDEVCLTVSPLLAGPGAGRITAGATGPLRPMTLRHVLAAGDHLLLRYLRA